MTHLLVVEDEPRLRQDLVDFLSLCGFDANGVSSASELRLALLEQSHPDVIILDVGLPDGNGFDLAVEIRNQSGCGIIMLTALGDSADRIRGYDSGADIYLVKHSTLREIEAAIRSLLRRAGADTALNGNGRANGWILDGSNWTLTPPDACPFKLTAAEFILLQSLCAQSGEVCDRGTLIGLLSRSNGGFDSHHLDALVSRLRRKIAKHTDLEVPIKVVYGVGYTFTVPAHVR